MSVTLFDGTWGGSPKIPLTFTYDYRRNGANMEYRVTVQVGVMPSSTETFGYKITSTITLKSGSNSVTDPTILVKPNSPNTWSTPYIYTTGWMSVPVGTGGVATLSITIGTNAPRGASTYNYGLYVVPLSTMTCPSSIVLEKPVTFNITKSDPSHYHSIVWYIGSRHGEVCSHVSNTSVVWTPTDLALDFSANLGPSKISDDVEFSLVTFNGNSEIARVSYSSKITLPVYKPIIDSAKVSLDNSANSVINGWGVAVKGYTKLKWTITAHTLYNGTIANDGYHIYGLTDSAGTGETGTTEAITESGVKSPYAKVVDARSMESDIFKIDDIEIYDYSSPKFTSVATYRCNANGTSNPSGTYLYVKCTGDVGSSIGNRNSVSIKCTTKPRIDGGGTSTVQLGSDGTAIISGYALSYSYNVQFEIIDSVGNKDIRSIIIPSGTMTFALGDGGKTVGFGKYPETSITFTDEVSGNSTKIDEFVQSAWPTVAPYSVLGGHKTQANTMVFSNVPTTLAVTVASGNSGEICSRLITEPGHYICIGSVDKVSGNADTICSAFFRSDADDTNQGALFGMTTRTTSQAGGGVMTMAFLNVTDCDEEFPASVELWTYNYDSVACNFRGLMVCFRVD